MTKTVLKKKGILAGLLLGLLVTTSAQAESYLVRGQNSLKNLKADVAAAGGMIVREFPQIGYVVVESDNPAFADTVAAAGVTPDLHISPPQTQDIGFSADAANPPSSGDDDFLFDLQWGHIPARAQEAWAAGQRGQGVTVAVLDEGFDLTHPDLAPNIVDAVSFVPGEGPQYELTDPFSHGSHTSGTIGAADNGFGTIGIAPEVDLMLVKVLSENIGSGAFSWIIEGILYAADNGADVINMSLGTIIYQGAGPDSRYIAELKVAVNKAITYAYQKGVTVVVSAGNDELDLNDPENASLINFNGFASHAISVSAVGSVGWAVDPANTDFTIPAYYTNIGPEIDFASSGGAGYFTPGNCTVAGVTRPCYVFDFVFSTGSLGRWYWSIGTSMAAPHAAGIAALIIGENGGDMNPALVKAEMRLRAQKAGKPGSDDIYGYGVATSGY